MNVKINSLVARRFEAWRFNLFGSQEEAPQWVKDLVSVGTGSVHRDQDPDELEQCLHDNGSKAGTIYLKLRTSRGDQDVYPGDYLVRDAAGTVRVYSESEFSTMLECDDAPELVS